MNYICPNCGKELTNDSMVFCPKCGSKIERNQTNSKANGNGSRETRHNFNATDDQNQSYYSGQNNRQYYENNGQQSFTDFKENVGERMSSFMNPNAGMPRTAAGMSTYVPALSDGEQIVKQYICCRTVRPDTLGSITVTNKRVMYTGTAADSKSGVLSEVGLKSISGIRTSYGTNYDSFKIKAAIVLGIIAIILFYLAIRSASILNAYGSSSGGGVGIFVILGIICLLLVGLCLYNCIQERFYLMIFSSEATGAPIQIGQGASSFKGNEAQFSVNGVPARDTQLLMDEFGALINDLQQLGDMAIEKWKAV